MNNNINALVERVKLALLWPEKPKPPDEQEWLALAVMVFVTARAEEP